jgi:hypothetical protein
MTIRHLSLCLVVALGAAAGACRKGPTTSVLAPSPIQPMTSPVEGTVRIVGGGVLAGATVAVSGVADSAVTQIVSDHDGHYTLPPLPARGRPQVTATGLQGYVSGDYPLPIASIAAAPVRIDIHVQPELTLVDRMEFELSNDDLAFGNGSNVQPRLWPVKEIQVGRPAPGATILAEWSGDAQISMWLEDFDTIMSSPTLVPFTAVLNTSNVYYSNNGRLRVGQPASLGGLREPVKVRLTLRPPAAAGS